MKILLGVTGSIAAYKAYDACRMMIKDGHEVIVVLTKGALRFIKKETFTYLGAKRVFSHEDDFTEQLFDGPVLHISLAKWCEKIIILPLSANTLAKIAHGQADDLLTSTLLSSSETPVLLYPAMNTQMLLHKRTAQNISLLKEFPYYHFHSTDEGLLACGDTGEGKLPALEKIKTLYEWLPACSLEESQVKKILITTGATISPIDPVRYITNGSTGITGMYMARKFLQQGHHVDLFCGIHSTKEIDYLKEFKHVRIFRCSTTKEMAKKIQQVRENCDLFIAAAAVSDFEFAYRPSKIKKEALRLNEMNLSYEMAEDILLSFLKVKKEHQLSIGMAAESKDHGTHYFIEKWMRKKTDLLIGNYAFHQYGDENEVPLSMGFGQESNGYYFIEEGQVLQNNISLSKNQLANEIYQWFLTKKAVYDSTI